METTTSIFIKVTREAQKARMNKVMRLEKPDVELTKSQVNKVVKNIIKDYPLDIQMDVEAEIMRSGCSLFVNY